MAENWCLMVFGVVFFIFLIVYVLAEVSEGGGVDQRAAHQKKFMQTCPACHDSEVAKTATACPNCGHVFKRSR